MFRVAPTFKRKNLEMIPRYKTFKTLPSKGIRKAVSGLLRKDTSRSRFLSKV